MSNIGSVYFFSLLSSLCFLFGLNYLIRPSKLVVSKILALTFLTLGYLFIASYAILKENILNYPHFFRTIAPLFYALPPLNFLFLWYLFHPRDKFHKAFFLLFLPLLLQFIENAKFFFSSREVKIQEIHWMLQQGDYFAFSPEFMWFDPIWHVYTKFVLYILSFLAMCFFYIRFRLNQQYGPFFSQKVFIYWVGGILFSRLFTVVYILYTFILATDGKVTFINTDYLLIAEFVFHIAFLVANPKFLDVQILAKHLQKDNVTEEVESVRDEDRLQEIATKVEQCFETEQVFLNSQLSAELLGSLTGYPHRMIGQAIKWKYNMSFRDYLNNYRIRYIEEMLSDPQLLQKTSIEAIAEASGFGSRQSFYTAVRKAKGCTPKEYFTSKQG